MNKTLLNKVSPMTSISQEHSDSSLYKETIEVSQWTPEEESTGNVMTLQLL